MATFDVSAAWVASFFLLMARMGGLVLFAPFFGSFVISPLTKILLSLSFSFALFPLVQDRIPLVSGDLLPFALGLGRELLIGMMIGLVAHFLLASLQVAGQIMGFQMGFSVVNVIDPQTQVETPVLSILGNVIGILVFLSINAHHWLIEALVDSYQIVSEPASVSLSLAEAVVKSSAEMMLLGFKLAAPLVMVLFIVDVLLGIVGRAAPQIHVLIVGMPAKALMGFTFLAATVHTLVPFFGRHLGGLREELYRYLVILGS